MVILFRLGLWKCLENQGWESVGDHVLPMLGGGGGGGEGRGGEGRGGEGRGGEGRRWTAEESPVHINVLELHAAKLTLMALTPNVSPSHIPTMAAAYIDKMGVCTPPLAMRLILLYF